MEGFLPAFYNLLVTCTLIYNTGLGRPYIKLEPCQVCNVQLRYGKRGIRVILHFSPMSLQLTGHASSDLEEHVT